MKAILFRSLALLCGLQSPLLADMASALSLPARTENCVFRDRLQVTWLPDGQSFWYRVQTGPQTQEYVRIDASTGDRRTAADLKSLGLPETASVKTSAMPVQLRKTVRTGVESGLKFINQLDADVDLFWISQSGEHVRYGGVRAHSEREQQTYEGHVWLVTSRTGEHLAVVEATTTPQTIIIDGKGIMSAKAQTPKSSAGQKSPDGKWSAVIRGGFVYLNDKAMKLDGARGFSGGVAWAPDSSAFVVSRANPVPQRQVTIVESAPKDQVQPKVKVIDYTKPGDELPKPRLVLVHPQGDSVVISDELASNPFTQSPHIDVRWAPDGREFYFDYNQRGHQLYRIIAVNAATAEMRVVVEESSKTFIDYTQKTWRQWLDKTGELLWMSERDGWCHLWLYDAKSGAVKNQVTRGTWPVREVLRVDEVTRQVWFMASGLRAGEDPYHRHLCRANFDGSGFVQLTEGDGNHRIEFSPGNEYFIDQWSRVDSPPLHELRRSVDGQRVCLLEKADASKLMATGWQTPERFVTKGRDGKTEIFGIIIRPSAFDPKKKYPVVEEVYAGPHSAFVPKDFGRLVRQHQIADLGFIVVQADGMGTNHRGKHFHDVCWKNLKDAGFPDRIAWIKGAAKTRPWMDLSRVGIYGGSAGGQSAMRALLDYHDFYTVAVADCGCHDNRMDKIWWNEQWMGWPVDESYSQSSNVEDAGKLQGHLLLMVGELDTNVDPSSTAQVVGALQRAGKDFEFMPIMGTGHGAAETPYGSRLRMEFLIRHLRP